MNMLSSPLLQAGETSMVANILDGKAVAASRRQQLAQGINKLQQQTGQVPGLAVIMIGEHPASQVYVRNKRRACAEVGIHSIAHDLPASTDQASLLALIEDLNQDPKIHGILVQLPLPEHLDSNAILEAIAPHKDVDGFHPYNLGRLAQRRPLLRPSTPYGIITLLEHYDIALRGLNAVVVGASNIVGRPMALELLLAGSTTDICHRFTRDLAAHVQRAELVIVAIGKPGIVQSEWFSPEAIVVDVGISRLADGSLCGDVDFATAVRRVKFITPVPGGVGPMTVLGLLENTYQACLASTC